MANLHVLRPILALIVFMLASTMAAAACPSLLDVKLPTLTEDAASLCRYQGKVLLVVNTASQCGYTPLRSCKLHVRRTCYDLARIHVTD